MPRDLHELPCKLHSQKACRCGNVAVQIVAIEEAAVAQDSNYSDYNATIIHEYVVWVMSRSISSVLALNVGVNANAIYEKLDIIHAAIYIAFT